MTENRMRPIHPGEIIKEDLMTPRGLSANALAKALHVPANRITSILNARRGVTADTALRLAHYTGTSAAFWMNLQSAYDLRTTERERGAEIAKTVRPPKGKAA
jgi:antitoxin HigA-1